MNGLFGGFLGLVHTIGEHVLIAIIYVAVGKKLPEDADVRYIELSIGSIVISILFFILCFLVLSSKEAACSLPLVFLIIISIMTTIFENIRIYIEENDKEKKK